MLLLLEPFLTNAVYTIYAFPQGSGDELHLVLADDQGRGEGQHIVEPGHCVGVVGYNKPPLLAARYRRRDFLRAGWLLGLLVLHELYAEEQSRVTDVAYVGVVF